MYLKAFSIVVFLLFVGCAVEQAKTDLSQDLKTNNIAVAFYMGDKKINYSEMVYKVLWNQTETQDGAFGSLWDIDRDLSTKVAGVFARNNLMAVPIQDVLKSSADYRNFQKTLGDSPVVFDSSRKPFVLDDQTCEALKRANIKYLILERSSSFEVDASSRVYGTLPSVLTVYDVDGKKQVYDAIHWFALNHEISVKNPREIETDGLKIFKETIYQLVENSQNFYAYSLRLK